MKRYYIPHLIAIIFMLGCCLIATSQISKNCNFSQLQYQYTDTVIDGVTYRIYSADGMSLSEIPGAPVLPCHVYSFSVPYNATNIAIQLNKNRSQFSQLQNCTIMPAMYPKAICDTTPIQIQPDSIIYNTNAYYPSDMAEITGEGYYMGENHIVTVAVYPMQYNPVTGMLKHNQSVPFTITYNIGNDTITNALVRNDLSMRQQAWNEVKRMVDNPAQVEAFAPNEPAVLNMISHYIPDSLLVQLGDSTAQYGGELFTPTSEYMIVTTRPLKHSFRRLAALKRQKGYTVGVKCIEDIVNSPSVQFGDRVIKSNGTYSCINDSAGKLRQYLRLAYTIDQTRFVLFGGQGVPFRYWYNDSHNNFVPTDWYYNDLTNNWNKNGNNLYGERRMYSIINGSFDYSPELYVGRLMAQEIEDVNNYTNKLLIYELNPGKGDTGYLKRAYLTNGFKESQWNNITNILHNSYSALFPSLTTIYEPTLVGPTGMDIINEINNTKFGFLGIHGHGSPVNVCVNGKLNPIASILSRHSYKSSPYSMGIDSLRNKYYPTIYYSTSCTTIPFDNHGILSGRINIGQSFTLGKDYGGVAFLGNSRVAYYSGNVDTLSFQTQMEYYFMKSLNSGIYNIGHLETISKELSIKNYISISGFPDNEQLAHNLMGEPEFEIWTDEPTKYSGINITRSDNSITVTGINADSTIVAVCNNNGNAIRRHSVNGSVTFTDVSPNSTIMLYKHNYLPYIAPMYVQNTEIANSQYVFASKAYFGKNVDYNRTVGNVTIPAGVNYEMEITGEAVLAPGFEVEQGAEFSVSLSDY